MFTCEVNMNMLFNFKYWFCFRVENNLLCSKFFRNLISVSKLVPFEHSIKFSKTFSLFYKFDCIRNDILSDGVYYISL